MVKTHVKTELLMCLFLLARGGLVTDRWDRCLPDGAGRRRAAERALPPFARPLPLCWCAVSGYLPNLRPARVRRIPHPTLLSPILPGSGYLHVFVEAAADSRYHSCTCVVLEEKARLENPIRVFTTAP